jgi:general secretion pathway protein M
MSLRMDAIALPQGRAGRLSALGLTLVAALILWLGLLSPLVGLYADRAARLHDDRALLTRMSALGARVPALRSQLAAIGADAPGHDSFLPGSRDASAAAALQQMVMSIAGEHALTLASVTVLRAEPAGDSRRIGVRLAFSARWSDLVAFLHAVDASHPSLVADDLSVQAQGSGDQLDVGLTVQGFRAASSGAKDMTMPDTTTSEPAE